MQEGLIHTALRAAREQAEEGRKALVEGSPAALERCAEALNAAIAGLRAGHAEHLGAGGSAGMGGRGADLARAEAQRLHADLRVLTRLLEHAAGYHARWLGFAGSAWAGYTGSGSAAGVPRRGRLLTQG
jgi:hypothetical protein